tara:strand:+ start:1872 stop:2144 length:273 start_codon:yes stop_codon:yes gene_type:complete
MKLSQVGNQDELNKWLLMVLKLGTKEQIEYSASTFFDIAEKYDNAFGFDGHIDGTVGVGKITFAESVLQDEIHYILTSGKYDKRALLQIR